MGWKQDFTILEYIRIWAEWWEVTFKLCCSSAETDTKSVWANIANLLILHRQLQKSPVWNQMLLSQVSQKKPDRLRGLHFSPASWALLLHSESCAKATAAEEVATGCALHLRKHLIGSNTQITTRGFHSIPHLLPLWQALKRVQANWALKRFYGPWIAVATFQWYCKWAPRPQTFVKA